MPPDSLPSQLDTTRPTRTRRSIFVEFTRQAVSAFPNLQGSLLITDFNASACYANVDFAETGLTPETLADYINGYPTTQQIKRGEQTRSCAPYDPQKKLFLIFINEDFLESELADVPAEKEKALLQVLDHELGHCAIRNGRYTDASLGTKALAESVAMAYALIRRYQRYGTAQLTDLPPPWLAYRLILKGDKEHCAVFVVEEIIKRKHLIDFEKLTPPQAATLARRFAINYTIPAPAIEDAYNIFKPVRDAVEAYPLTPEDWLKVMVNVTLGTSNHIAFKLGLHVLSSYLHSRADFDGTPFTLPEDYWSETRQKLKDRADQFAQKDILMDMPLEQKPAGFFKKNKVQII